MATATASARTPTPDVRSIVRCPCCMRRVWVKRERRAECHNCGHRWEWWRVRVARLGRVEVER